MSSTTTNNIIENLKECILRENDKVEVFRLAISLGIKKSLIEGGRITGDFLMAVPKNDVDLFNVSRKIAPSNIGSKRARKILLQNAILDVFDDFDVDKYKSFPDPSTVLHTLVWGKFRNYEKYWRNTRHITWSNKSGNVLIIDNPGKHSQISEKKTTLSQEKEFHAWLCSRDANNYNNVLEDWSSTYFLWNRKTLNYPTNHSIIYVPSKICLSRILIDLLYYTDCFSVSTSFNWDNSTQFSHPKSFASTDKGFIELVNYKNFSRLTDFLIAGVEYIDNKIHIVFSNSVYPYRSLPGKFGKNFRDRNPFLNVKSNLRPVIMVENIINTVKFNKGGNKFEFRVRPGSKIPDLGSIFRSTQHKNEIVKTLDKMSEMETEKNKNTELNNSKECREGMRKLCKSYQGKNLTLDEFMYLSKLD